MWCILTKDFYIGRKALQLDCFLSTSLSKLLVSIFGDYYGLLAEQYEWLLKKNFFVASNAPDTSNEAFFRFAINDRPNKRLNLASGAF